MVQNQLNLATANSNGTLVNGQTGGRLFGTTNALAVQDGVFKTETLTLGSETTLDRDIISLNLIAGQADRVRHRIRRRNRLLDNRQDSKCNLAASDAARRHHERLGGLFAAGTRCRDRGQVRQSYVIYRKSCVAMADFRYSQHQFAVFIL